jgi:2,3-bisphosphoglycerate-dependent phosphoglycerate mutase
MYPWWYYTMAKLVLVRHGESQWNAIGRWTGWTDIPLTREGMMEAERAGLALKGINFAVAFTSKLIRARQTLDFILKELKHSGKLPIYEDAALNERNYGDYTGKNKWEIKKTVGDAAFQALRRGWDNPIKNGETLKDVYGRVIPYYQNNILPYIVKRENVLVVAHGNSLRALVKYLENIPDAQAAAIELNTGEIVEYEISPDGKIDNKKIITVRTDTHPQ